MPRGERVPWSIFISSTCLGFSEFSRSSFSFLNGLLSLVGGLQCWFYVAPTNVPQIAIGLMVGVRFMSQLEAPTFVG